jgi:hypothetical protein
VTITFRRCPHGGSNPGFGLERAASWSTRRWGQRRTFYHPPGPPSTIRAKVKRLRECHEGSGSEEFLRFIQFVRLIIGIPRSHGLLGMTHAHMSLRVPQGRSNILKQKIASSHWHAPRNDRFRDSSLAWLAWNDTAEDVILPTSCELKARRKLFEDRQALHSL